MPPRATEYSTANANGNAIRSCENEEMANDAMLMRHGGALWRVGHDVGAWSVGCGLVRPFGASGPAPRRCTPSTACSVQAAGPTANGALLIWYSNFSRLPNTSTAYKHIV